MKRVLIVDDASFMRMSIKNMLANYDFEIVGEAENGVMAIEKYKELQPDIVTTVSYTHLRSSIRKSNY